ncbi:MAG: anthranilate synthase component I family protein [Candidatus Hodarchaeota archaeon]
MDLNINIQKLGKTDDIFGFYKYLTKDNESKNSVLLESVGEQSHEMLFSFIGLKPDFMVKVIGDKLDYYAILSETGEKIKDQGGSGSIEEEQEYKMPFDDEVALPLKGLDILKDIFPISRSAMPELFPRKIFSGGFLGYIGYDVVSPYVGYKASSKIQEEFPDIIMGFFTTVLTYSHTTKTLYLINNNIGGYTPDEDITGKFEKFKNNGKGKGGNGIKIDRTELMKQETDFKTNTSLDEWIPMIQQTGEHIKAGDIIQAVISRKMTAETDADPIDVYGGLRFLNPSPYMFYLDFEDAHDGDIRIIGSSPEALITKNEYNLETVPIAGTRRRGRTPEDEIKMENELLHSEKELAEHVMLVDLARNDLAKVSVPGSVETYKLIQLKKFPNVMHLISKVRSKSFMDPFTVLKSMFPAGTVSGAPKKRAMEIIHELEKEDRGPYAGCTGYISFTGDMDMAINIRTIFNKNKKYIAQAGAGIVADSKPEEEYLETKNKLQGVLSTINYANLLLKGRRK